MDRMIGVAREVIKVRDDRVTDTLRRLSEELARVFSTMPLDTEVIITIQARMPEQKEAA